MTQGNYEFLSVCLKLENLPPNYFRKIAEKLSFRKIPLEFWGKYGWVFSFFQLSFEKSVQKKACHISAITLFTKIYLMWKHPYI